MSRATNVFPVSREPDGGASIIYYYYYYYYGGGGGAVLVERTHDVVCPVATRAHGENTYSNEHGTTRSFFVCPLRSRRIGNKLISVPKTEKLAYTTINARKLPTGGRDGVVY